MAVLASAVLCHATALACPSIEARDLHELIRKADPVALVASSDDNWSSWSASRVGVWGHAFFKSGRQACNHRLIDATEGVRHVELQYRAEESEMKQSQAGGAVVLRFAVRKNDAVWTLMQSALAGQRLSCETTVQEAMRPHNGTSRPPWRGRCEDLPELELKRPLSAGSVLLASDLRKPPMVRSQTPVSAVTRIGAIGIETAAVALEDGEAGQQIRLKAEHSGAMLKGVVIAPARVLIQ